MLGRFSAFVCAALPMNLASACVEGQLGDANAPFFLIDRFVPLWWIAAVLQPWSLVLRSGYGGAVVASIASGLIYSLIWWALCRFSSFRRFASRLRFSHTVCATAVVAVPYLALFFYALYIQHYEPPPPPPPGS